MRDCLIAACAACLSVCLMSSLSLCIFAAIAQNLFCERSARFESFEASFISLLGALENSVDAETPAAWDVTIVVVLARMIAFSLSLFSVISVCIYLAFKLRHLWKATPCLTLAENSSPLEPLLEALISAASSHELSQRVLSLFRTLDQVTHISNVDLAILEFFKLQLLTHIAHRGTQRRTTPGS